MGLDNREIEGRSLLNEEEKEGLKILGISTHEELDELEQKNIESAIIWTSKKNIPFSLLISEQFIKDLHRRMFGDVWQWAGCFRKSDKNIGYTSAKDIPVEIKKLIDNCLFWISHKTFPEDEIAIRFSHNLVLIHPFPNGNGRHCRLMADLIMEHVFAKPRFIWGGKNIKSDHFVRLRYIQALHKADQYDFKDLLDFAHGKQKERQQ